MLSLGAAAYLEDKTLVGTFQANLVLLLDATPDPSTMQWWKTQPKAWEACRENLQDPSAAMYKFVSWIEELEKKHNARSVYVGYPVAYDFMFTYWYMMHFVGRSPFRHSGLDIKTMAFTQLKKGYRAST